MSLLFESAIAAFSVKDASLYKHGTDRSLRTDTTSPDRLPVEAITGYAVHHNRLRHPDRDGWLCIPLHEQASADLTGEYIVYTEHDLRGEVFIYRSDGTQQTIAADDLARSPLATRLRYWHSDYVPESAPPYYDSPLSDRESARNPLSIPSEDVFDELSAFIEDERSAQREENVRHANSKSPASIAEQGGAAIPALRSYGSPTNGQYRFHVQRNGSKETSIGRGRSQASIQTLYGVFEGNEVLLYPPDERFDPVPDAFPLPATVTDLTGSNLYLAIDWEAVEDRPRVRGYLRRERRGFGLVSVLNTVPYERETEAIATLRGRDRSGAVLSGQTDLTFTNSALAESTPFDAELNQEQHVAVEHALLADDLFCIHGPPGTGKTRTLIEIIRRAAEADRSVLVCADSNQAVDNLVAGSSSADDPDPRSLHAYGQHGVEEFTLTRINPNRSQQPIIETHYPAHSGENADVVCATNSSAASLDRPFALAVLDEATQATCTASCIPWARAEKLVLAGDHQQLPPFSATETPPKSTYGMSLFEHLYAVGGVYEGVGMQLRTQYRMHDHIADFPNRRFYDRSLRNGRTVPTLGKQPAIVGYDIGGQETVRGTSLANPIEARLISHLALGLLSDDSLSAALEPSQIGIITPYRGQVRLIEKVLRDKIASDHQLTVDTIDSFQGSEKTAVLISLVRSNPSGDIGFMGRSTDGPRRLNVAITRAQRYCALIGDWDTLRASIGTDQTNIDQDRCTDLYDDLYAYLDDTGRLRHVEPELIPSP